MQCLHQPTNCEFCGAIGHQVGDPNQTGNGGEADDVATILLLHMGQKGLDGPELREHIHIKHPLDFLG